MADGIVQRDAEDGMSHVAVYTVQGEMVQVTYLGKHPTNWAHIGGSTPQTLANIMLGESIRET